MLAHLKTVLFAALCVGGLALVAYMSVMKLSLQLVSHRWDLPEPPLPAGWEPSDAADDRRRARGERLVRGVLGCSGCHGPYFAGKPLLTDPEIALAHSPDLGRFAQRARLTPAVPMAVGQAPGGDAAWVRALRWGLRDDGRALWLMPQHALSHMSDRDLMDAVAYLSTLPVGEGSEDPPAHLLAAKGRVLVALRRIALFDFAAPKDNRPAARPVAAQRPAQSVGYGAYLVTIGRCRSCHGARSFLAERFGPSPLPEGPPWDGRRLRRLGKGAFARALAEGRRLDGTPLEASVVGHDYRALDETQVAALWMALCGDSD